MKIQDEIKKDLARELKKSLYTCCTHNFVNANDGTGDKICAICGIRAKQGRMCFNRQN